MNPKWIVTAAACAFACGGSSTPGPQPCTITLSGAQTGTYDCQAALGAFSSSDNRFSVTATTSTSDPDVGFVVSMPGDLHTGTFKDTDSGAESLLTVSISNSSKIWMAEAGSTKHGSYTMNLTSAGSRVPGNSGAAYLYVHGTLTAVLEAVPGTSASGTVNMSATF